MALNTKDIALINDMNTQSENRIMDAISGLGSGVRAKIEAEVNRIDLMDQRRNGTIGEHKKKLKILRKRLLLVKGK